MNIIDLVENKKFDTQSNFKNIEEKQFCLFPSQE